MAYRLVQVGTGGFGALWCRHFLPPFVREGRIEVVAAVDTDPAALVHAREGLGLPEERCTTDLERALNGCDADICTVVVPPASHEPVVQEALAHGCHILSDKPIADSLPAACRIAHRVRAASRKMGVTMSHRFDQDKQSLIRAVRSGRYGRLDYALGQHTVAVRRKPEWGAFRYEIPDAQLVEGGVHYLDILADLAGAPCERVYAETWNPPWSEFRGDPQALVTLRFQNGVRAVMEMCAANAVGLYPWGYEGWRAECELGALLLDHRELEEFVYDPSARRPTARPGEGRRVPLVEGERWGHLLLIEQFLDWLDGGPAMPTNVEDNLQSVALFAAAIESSRTGRAVEVQTMLNEALRAASV